MVIFCIIFFFLILWYFLIFITFYTTGTFKRFGTFLPPFCYLPSNAFYFVIIFEFYKKYVNILLNTNIFFLKKSTKTKYNFYYLKEELYFKKVLQLFLSFSFKFNFHFHGSEMYSFLSFLYQKEQNFKKVSDICRMIVCGNIKTFEFPNSLLESVGGPNNIVQLQLILFFWIYNDFFVEISKRTKFLGFFIKVANFSIFCPCYPSKHANFQIVF